MSVKFSSKIDEDVLKELKAYAADSKKNISTVLNEAVVEYLKRARVRPIFIETSNSVIESNKDLLEKLAK